MSNLPIGVFDSGSGGFATCQSLLKECPEESIVYFGDMLYMPYGDQSDEFLVKRLKQVLRLFKTLNCKLLIIACNTAASIIMRYPDINNSIKLPIFNVVDSTANFIKSNIPTSDKITVLSTQSTFSSQIYMTLLNDKFKNLSAIATVEWAQTIEKIGVDSPETREIVKKYIPKIQSLSPKHIVLACTHYYYLIPILKELIPDINLIDSSTIVVEELKNFLTENELAHKNNPNPFHTIMTSKNQDVFTALAQKTFHSIKTELIFNDPI